MYVTTHETVITSYSIHYTKLYEALRSTDKETVVDGIINMNFLYNKVYHVLNSKSEPNRNSEVVLPYYTPKVMEWSLTQGESKHMEGRCLAIDEIHNVISFLERVENEEVMNVDFLELRACDQSCAGGALMSENRFLTVERVHTRANRIQKSGLKVEEVKQNHLEYVREHLVITSYSIHYTKLYDRAAACDCSAPSRAGRSRHRPRTA